MPGDPSAAWQERHRRLAELPAAPDNPVLDLGCGKGATFQELAGRVGAAGWLVGIDRTPARWPPPPPCRRVLRGGC